MTRKKGDCKAGDSKAGDTRYQSPLETQRRATQAATFAMNLTVLQRMDPTVVEICDMSGHAVVYRLDLKTQVWAKLDIEGSLFVVRRMAGFRVIVLNRSGIENFEQDITATTLIELQGPYIMCRASPAADVIGLWFYKEEEHASISALILQLVDICKQGGAGQHAGAPPAPTVPLAHRPPLPPQAASAQAGADLKDMLGIGGAGHARAGLDDRQGVAQEQAGADIRGMLGIGTSGGGGQGERGAIDPAAQASSHLMSMLNIGMDAGGQGRGGGGAAVQKDFPPKTAPAPSASADIMAMLGLPGLPGPGPNDGAAQQQAAVCKGGGSRTGADEAGAAVGPTPADLLHKSVAHTMARGKTASPAAATMTRAQFQQALQAAVQDEAFVDQLYAQYMGGG